MIRFEAHRQEQLKIIRQRVRVPSGCRHVANRQVRPNRGVRRTTKIRPHPVSGFPSGSTGGGSEQSRPDKGGTERRQILPCGQKPEITADGCGMRGLLAQSEIPLYSTSLHTTFMRSHSLRGPTGKINGPTTFRLWSVHSLRDCFRSPPLFVGNYSAGVSDGCPAGASAGISACGMTGAPSVSITRS